MIGRSLRIKSFWPGIGMFVLATALFCLPGNELPNEDWLGDINADKIIHVGLFAALVTLWSLPFINRSKPEASTRQLKRILLCVVMVAIGYGIAIEFIQGAYIPKRSYSVSDMLADALGSVI